MSESGTNIAVVYLSYIPYGITPFNDFVQSYIKHPAGTSHTLYLLFKGMEKADDLHPFTELADRLGISYKIIQFSEPGLDIEAYRFACTQLNDPYLFFLNTQSVILHPGWLLKIAAHITERIGIIGTTASFQSHYSSVFQNYSWAWKRDESMYVRFRRYKLLIKATLIWRWIFPAFPNPHIRTNAFLIDRQLFLKLRFPIVKDKFAAYQVESGYRSITRQIIANNRDVLLVDKKGSVYQIAEWNEPNVFWKGRQEDLFVSDKQTRLYENSSDAERKKMKFAAWGSNE